MDMDISVDRDREFESLKEIIWELERTMEVGEARVLKNLSDADIEDSDLNQRLYELTDVTIMCAPIAWVVAQNMAMRGIDHEEIDGWSFDTVTFVDVDNRELEITATPEVDKSDVEEALDLILARVKANLEEVEEQPVEGIQKTIVNTFTPGNTVSTSDLRAKNLRNILTKRRIDDPVEAIENADNIFDLMTTEIDVVGRGSNDHVRMLHYCVDDLQNSIKSMAMSQMIIRQCYDEPEADGNHEPVINPERARVVKAVADAYHPVQKMHQDKDRALEECNFEERFRVRREHDNEIEEFKSGLFRDYYLDKNADFNFGGKLLSMIDEDPDFHFFLDKAINGMPVYDLLLQQSFSAFFSTTPPGGRLSLFGNREPVNFPGN